MAFCKCFLEDSTLVSQKSKGVASCAVAAILPEMDLVFRRLVLLNAALWLGGGIFFAFLVGPTLFSSELAASITRRQAGFVAQTILFRYSWWQLFAAVVAVAGACMARRWEWRWKFLSLPLALSLLALVSVGGLFLQPQLRDWNERRYAEAVSPPDREIAARRFGQLHGIAQLANLLVLAGVLVHGFQQLPAGTREATRSP